MLLSKEIPLLKVVSTVSFMINHIPVVQKQIIAPIKRNSSILLISLVLKYSTKVKIITTIENINKENINNKMSIISPSFHVAMSNISSPFKSFNI